MRLTRLPSLELSRPVRPWEFLSSVGERAGLLGNEAGNFEAWVYPLKILRDFHLRFLVDGHVVPAEALARTLTVRPESQHDSLRRGHFLRCAKPSSFPCTSPGP